jgi:hypothetical protein
MRPALTVSLATGAGRPARRLSRPLRSPRRARHAIIVVIGGPAREAGGYRGSGRKECGWLFFERHNEDAPLSPFFTGRG